MSINDDDLIIQNYHVIPGQICAALYFGLWHRAEIVGSLNKDKTVKVNVQ